MKTAKMNITRTLILTVIVLTASFSCSSQEKPTISLKKLATGFTSPVGMACPDDGTGRIFIFEQSGKVIIYKNGTIVKTPFINISGRLDGLNIAYSEKGLLGMAFHPNYKSNGRFFLYYSAPHSQKGFDHKSVIAEFKVSNDNPDIAVDKPVVIMEILQPESNHNGGMLEFGPDGYLYIGTGDGGGANDEHGTIGNSQDKSNLLGKILRVDIDSKKPYAIPSNNPFLNQSGSKAEIYAYGLRNPWRFSFDRENGKLFCGDVGQNKFEEINIIKKGGNYGWRIMEGYHCFNPPTNCNKSGLELPIDEYGREKGISICGGYVYRGTEIPTLKGMYVFGDWSGKLYLLRQKSSGAWERIEPGIDGTGSNELKGKLNSMGQDINGNIYLLTQKMFGPKSPTGVLYKITK
jgi:glucose/arabinose dehydrogenase